MTGGRPKIRFPVRPHRSAKCWFSFEWPLIAGEAASLSWANPQRPVGWRRVEGGVEKGAGQNGLKRFTGICAAGEMVWRGKRCRKADFGPEGRSINTGVREKKRPALHSASQRRRLHRYPLTARARFMGTHRKEKGSRWESFRRECIILSAVNDYNIRSLRIHLSLHAHTHTCTKHTRAHTHTCRKHIQLQPTAIV